MKKPFASGVLLIAGALIMPGVLHARGQDIPPLRLQQDLPSVVADLEARIPRLLEEARIPGLQAALIRDGQVVWHGSFGLKNAASGEPVTDETVFEAASLTKPFFAFYVMKLVEQGLLGLDRPLVGYASAELLEKFLGHPLDEEGFRRDWFEKITIRQILSHSSGLPHGEQGRPFPLLFEPGSKWKYSADGYFLLQKVIEALKGDKLENLMQKDVLDPLGMTKSCLVWRDGYERTMANGHGFFGKAEGFRKRTESHAGASLYTTAEDYAKFVCAALNGEGLGAEALGAMLAPQIDMDKERGLGWGLGFGTQTDPSGFAIWQWGDYGIFRNYILAYPKEKTGVVYLTNSFYGLGICPDFVAHSVGGQALGSVSLNYRPYDWPVYRAGWAWADKGAGTAADAAELAGRFPEALSKEGLEFLSAVFEEAGRMVELVPVLQLYAGAHPRSGQAQMRLATAFFQGGDRSQARAFLKRAGRAKEDRVAPFLIKWDLEYIRAMDKPKKLKESYLRKIAGHYGPRLLEVRNGRLFYFREGGSSPDFRPLVALSKNVFVLQTLSSFRLRIQFDRKGNPLKAVGLYDDGRHDETARSK